MKTYSTREAVVRQEIVEPIAAREAGSGAAATAESVYASYDVDSLAFWLITTTTLNGPLEFYRNGTDEQFWARVDENRR